LSHVAARESVRRLEADFFDGVEVVKVGGLEETVMHEKNSGKGSGVREGWGEIAESQHDRLARFGWRIELYRFPPKPQVQRLEWNSLQGRLDPAPRLLLRDL
jgi:hypothetical protein